MGKKFEYLEHTADQYIRAFGKSLGEAFANGALAVFETMTDTKKIKPKETRFFTIEDKELESLLYSYIEELIILSETQGLMFSKFEVAIAKTKDSYVLIARCKGECFDSEKHESRCGVKAMTYCLMRIINFPPKVVLEFVIDI